MKKDSLGDRIKGYEGVSKTRLTKRTPVMIRLDGRAFHTLTRGMKKPFDDNMMEAMVLAATDVMANIQGAKVAYIQSDEVSIGLMDYDNINSNGWFNYNHSKIVSISAALMSVRFAHYMGLGDHSEVFDCRAFNVPECDLVNAFLWRAQDWSRNSIQMYAHANFGHKELHKKNKNDMHEMLHGIGKNWTTDLTARERNGTFLVKYDTGIHRNCEVLPTYNSINNVIDGLFDYPTD